jgi:pimeloyl-ACP methyl ester carboxylesterase
VAGAQGAGLQRRENHIPGAQLIVYPDSGHGSLFQYPELFVGDVGHFLDAEVAFA